MMFVHSNFPNSLHTISSYLFFFYLLLVCVCHVVVHVRLEKSQYSAATKTELSLRSERRSSSAVWQQMAEEVCSCLESELRAMGEDVQPHRPVDVQLATKLLHLYMARTEPDEVTLARVCANMPAIEEGLKHLGQPVTTLQCQLLNAQSHVNDTREMIRTLEQKRKRVHSLATKLQHIDADGTEAREPILKIQTLADQLEQLLGALQQRVTEPLTARCRIEPKLSQNEHQEEQQSAWEFKKQLRDVEQTLRATDDGLLTLKKLAKGVLPELCEFEDNLVTMAQSIHHVRKRLRHMEEEHGDQIQGTPSSDNHTSAAKPDVDVEQPSGGEEDVGRLPYRTESSEELFGDQTKPIAVVSPMQQQVSEVEVQQQTNDQVLPETQNNPNLPETQPQSQTSIQPVVQQQQTQPKKKRCVIM